MGGALPLSALLSRSLLDLDRTFEGLGAPGAPQPSIVLWSNVLRPLRTGPVARRDLPAAARVSRRAMTALLGAARQHALVRVEPSGPRTAAVALTPMGEVVHDTWAPLVGEAEAAWRARVGAAAVDRLRRTLVELVDRLDLELPHHPIGYGSADASMLGGRARPAEPGPPRIPAHGADWAPVLRDRTAGAAADLSLLALLSQALVAFAIDHEEVEVWPLAVTVNLLRHLAVGRPLAEVPAPAGITGVGTSFTERHGAVVVHEGIARLTSRGRGFVDRYLPQANAVEASWQERFGPVVTRLRTALEVVDRAVPADRAHFPLVAFGGPVVAEVSNWWKWQST